MNYRYSDIVDFILETIENTPYSGKDLWNTVALLAEKEFPPEKFHPEKVRSIYRRYANKSNSFMNEKNMTHEGGPVIKRTLNNLEATITIKENPANLSIDNMFNLFNIDKAKWECTGYTTKSWNTTLKGKDGNPVLTTNYSVKAVFKLKEKEDLTKEDLSWLFEGFRSKASKIKPIEVKPKLETYTGNTAVLALFDHHLGKLAWGEETGENYDIKIASNRFLEVAKKLIGRSNEIGVDKIIFPIGNDFFQFDNSNTETAKGTRVDSDIRWKKLFRVGLGLLKEVIDYASYFAPVDVLLVQGNHDNMMSFYAFEALRGWYDDNKYVIICPNIMTRTYRQIGVNLLGFTHGDKEKDNLYRIMQQEARELWGKTLHAEWLTGHYHKTHVEEKQGVIKRTISSLTGTDAWHYESGYIGSLKSAQSLIYNENIPGPYAILYESINIKEEKGQE